MKSEDNESASDKTYIVSAQSVDQSELISKHNPDKPLFVEGGFTVWLRAKSLTYFVLRSDTTELYHRYHEEAKNSSNDG